MATRAQNRAFSLIMDINRFDPPERLRLFYKFIPKIYDINQVSLAGNTFLTNILQYDDEEGNIEIIRHLLSVENIYLDINVSDGKDKTPLAYAFDHPSHISTIRLLIENGARDIDDLIRNGLAERFKDTTMLLYLFLKANQSCANIEILKSLIELGANINYVDETGKSILMLLAVSTNEEYLKLTVKMINENLFENITDTNMHQYSALTYCLNATANIELLKCILERTTYDDSQHNFLSWIILSNTSLSLRTKRKIFQLLCDYDFMHENKNIETPLIMKLLDISSGDYFIKIIRQLLLKGFDVNACNFHKINCLERAIRNDILMKNPETYKLLLYYGINYVGFLRFELEKVGISYPCKWSATLCNTFTKYTFISDIIMEIEEIKIQKRVLIGSIKDTYGMLTMSPSSIFAQVSAVKWDLAHKDKEDVYKNLSREFLDYIGINSVEDLEWKIREMRV